MYEGTGSRSSTQTRLALLGVVLVVIAVSCGDSAETATTTTATTTTATTTTTAEPSPQEQCVAEATAAVESAKEPITAVLPSESFDMSVNEGKKIWYVASVTLDERSQNMIAGYQEAGEAAGVDVMILDGKGSVEEWNALINQGIAAGVDGIQLMGIDPSLVEGPLQDALDAGIPVVTGAATNAGDPLPPTVLVDITTDFERDGRVMADYVLSQTGCRVETVLLTSSLFRVGVALNDGLTAEFARLCPDDCVLSVDEVDVTALPTALPVQTSAILLTNPDMKWLIPAFDVFSLFVIQGIDDVGAENVKLISHDGSPANLDIIRAGGPQAAAQAWAPAEYQAWLAFDALARAMAGLEVDTSVADMPGQLFDADNLGPTNDLADIFPGMSDFREQFMSLWGL